MILPIKLESVTNEIASKLGHLTSYWKPTKAIPVAEIGCYFQTTFQKPLTHDGTIHQFINKLESFVIKEKLKMPDGSLRSVLVQKADKGRFISR